MFLFFLYTVIGLCLLLMALGLLYPSFWKGVAKNSHLPVRIALSFFGIGLILSASYQAYVYYVIKPQIDARRSQLQDPFPPKEEAPQKSYP